MPTKKSTRKSPREHAKDFAIGFEKKGIDGNMWIIKRTSNGIKRWVLLGSGGNPPPYALPTLNSRYWTSIFCK